MRSFRFLIMSSMCCGWRSTWYDVSLKTCGDDEGRTKRRLTKSLTSREDEKERKGDEETGEPVSGR